MPQSASTEVAVRSPAESLVERIRSDDFRQQIAQALPENVSLDRFTRATATALLQNPDIAAIPDKASLFQAIIQSAQDGLVADGREAAIVKFGQKAAYLAMIGGLRKVAADYGWTLQTAVVYANDTFDYELGLEPRLNHKPVRPGEDRGSAIGAYAVAKHKDGRREFEVMTAAEIEKVRKTSRAANAGPWKDWPERMWEKTVGRRLFKKLPFGESERDRIQRLVREDFEPGEGAAVLYGQPAGLQPSTPAPASESVAAAPAPDGADGRDTTSPGADDEDIPMASSSDEPGPDPSRGHAPGPAVPPDLQAAAEAAAAYDPKSAKWPGMTLGEIFASGDAGRAWIEWCLAKAKGEKLQAVHDFAAAHMPEALS